MILKKLSIFAVSALFSTFLMCDSPTDVSTDDIIGTWKAVDVTYSWDYTEDGVNDKGSEHETDYNIILKFNENAVTSYSYSDDDDCYDTDVTEYTLVENRLKGEDFEGEEGDAEETDSWYTEVTKNGDQLVITFVENYSSTDESGWEKEIITMKRYNGDIPSQDWPEDRCMYKKQVKRFLNAKRK